MQTLERRVTDLAAFIQEENRSHILTSAAWGIQMDESTDKSGHAQAILYARFIDGDKGCVDKKFLTILRVTMAALDTTVKITTLPSGIQSVSMMQAFRSEVQNIYSTLNEYVEVEDLPKDKLV